MEDSRRRKRHCWECRRRCLVCDFTEPACRRCSTAGVECPGYGDVKPMRLEWLAPGRVVSRGSRRKSKRQSDGENRCQVNNFASRSEEVPAKISYVPWFEMKTDVCALPQAAEYFNSCIYKDLVPIHQFGQNPHIYPLTDRHLRVGARAPEYLQFGMVCMTLSHRLNRTRSDTQSSKVLAERFYIYWGLAVRSLTEHLNAQDEQTSDVVIAGILTILLADVQNGNSLNWRCHMEGVHRIISLRGGFRAMAGSRRLEPLLLVLWSVAVIGNTTCSASDLTMTGLQLDAVDLVVDQYATSSSPFQMCPLSLYGELIKINHLRSRALRSRSESHAQEAHEMLERIHDFSPREWAKLKPHLTPSSMADWALLGAVYKAAVALYCVLSLQSLSVLPTTTLLRDICATHGQILKSHLEQALQSPQMGRFLVWPMVLLGVEAVHGDAAMRGFVSMKLPELSRDLGTHVPLTAKHVLERFWASGETTWDACFDRRYAFTAQLAVDTSRLSLYDEK
ncbi:hypothetical protein CKAH01_01993 [Colletotrichum kahawae]|uniref:Zn(2)-C6 fungal-type domain-containing protein n=1 Tax=Colletotrichum kahawae TaxID=34407 RepID=A0AAE0D166_COLKA|nr:hypothetical protein CKAH01_01993 [Colletotrichum kahawae]